MSGGKKKQGDIDVSSPCSGSSPEDVAARDDGSKSNKLRFLAAQTMLENLSPNVRKRVEALKEIQDQHDELEAKWIAERAALEEKYQNLYETLYTKRYEIVNGMVEVEGITNVTTEETPAKNKASEEKGVPDFWLHVLETHDFLAYEIQKLDKGALKFLKDIKCCRLNNPNGFELEFFFDSNPFFKNSVLTKTYHVITGDRPVLERVIGTEIEWFPGKCLTHKLKKKKPKKGSKNTKRIINLKNPVSFFNFFTPPKNPMDAGLDEETGEQLMGQLTNDLDIASTIRSEIIQHAVSWFTGEAIDLDESAGPGKVDEGDKRQGKGGIRYRSYKHALMNLRTREG